MSARRPVADVNRRRWTSLRYRNWIGESGRGSETTTRGGGFECSGCIVQFLSSRKPVLELHLLMVSESVASYRLVGVLASAAARDFGGVLRAGYSSVGDGWCAPARRRLWANKRDSSQHSFSWSSATLPVIFSVAGRLAVPSAVSSTGGGNGNPGEWYSKRACGPLLRRA